MSKKRIILYAVPGVFCVGYYFAMGFFSRFGLAQSWVWFLFAGAFFVGAIGSVLPIPKTICYIWRSLLALGMACLLGLAGFVGTGMTAKLPDKLDVMIILGARVDPGPVPSKSLQRRLTAAEKYLANNPNTLVIASGGKGEDEEISEAQCIFDVLTAAGIAPERIIMEEESRSTAENFANCRRLITDENARIGFITNNYHVRRSLLLAKAAGFEKIEACAAPFEGILPLHFVVRECIGIVVEFLQGHFR